MDICVTICLFYIKFSVQETLNIVSREVPTDNGITKEFDPLRNSKEEQSKTPQSTTHQVKREFQYFHCFTEINLVRHLVLSSEHN